LANIAVSVYEDWGLINVEGKASWGRPKCTTAEMICMMAEPATPIYSELTGLLSLFRSWGRYVLWYVWKPAAAVVVVAVVRRMLAPR
jgi:hypothetical protein